MIASLALEVDSDQKQKQRSASLEIEASAVDIAVGMEEQFTMFTTTSNREKPSITGDDRLSFAKFVLITLVVVGHFIEAYSKAGNRVATIIMHLIYSFHVPAFVLISG